MLEQDGRKNEQPIRTQASRPLALCAAARFTGYGIGRFLAAGRLGATAVRNPGADARAHEEIQTHANEDARADPDSDPHAY